MLAAASTGLGAPAVKADIAQEPRSDEPTSAAAELRELLEAPRYANARWGVLVCDEPSGETSIAHAEGGSFLTASNLKLVSTACALAELGPEHRFRTELAVDGHVRSGTLHGDLILRGGGDPTLGGRMDREPDAAFRHFARALEDAGVRRVRGRVLGDDGCQAERGFGDGWAWDYQYAWYAAPVSGLCYRENVFTAVVEWPAAASTPSWHAEPECSLLELDALERVRAAQIGERSELDFWRTPGSHRFQAFGVLERGGSAWRYDLSVEDPALYAAAALADALERNGIAIEAQRDGEPRFARGRADSQARTVATWSSPRLEEIVIATNTASQNLYAEQILRAAAKHARGSSDIRSARAVASAWLSTWGADPTECFVADGSGLSRENLLSPRAIVALLRAQLRATYRTAFLDSLPRAGASGTLEKRLRDLPPGVEVRAKTGSISQVKALSGYIAVSGVVRRTFSILVNDSTRVAEEDVKRDIDRFVRALAEEVARGS